MLQESCKCRISWENVWVILCCTLDLIHQCFTFTVWQKDYWDLVKIFRCFCGRKSSIFHQSSIRYINNIIIRYLTLNRTNLNILILRKSLKPSNPWEAWAHNLHIMKLTKCTNKSGEAELETCWLLWNQQTLTCWEGNCGTVGVTEKYIKRSRRCMRAGRVLRCAVCVTGGGGTTQRINFEPKGWQMRLGRNILGLGRLQVTLWSAGKRWRNI